MNSTPEIRQDIPREFVQEWDLAQDPDAVQCPFHAAKKLHDGPDIFYNLTFDLRNQGQAGNWVVTRRALQKEILQNPAVFSSHRIAGFSALLGEDWPLVPLEIDPPEHAEYRALVNPLFSPREVNDLEESVRQSAIDLIDKAKKEGECEFMQAFGRPFPVGVFMRLMGLPLEEMPTFLQWEEDILRGKSIEARAQAAGSIKDYLLELIAKRRKNPTGDLVSFAVRGKINGQPIPEDHILGLCFLLFVGGLDTVAAVLGFTFKELATHPEQQSALRKNPDLTMPAVEEYLRAFGVVTTSRFLTRDFEFHGFNFRRGDRVSITTGLASRDDMAYERPDEIDFHRRDVRNLTLSAGPHRCLGSHLARREFMVALQEWMKRVPEFRIKGGQTPIVHSTGVWGVDYLPLVW